MSRKERVTISCCYESRGSDLCTAANANTAQLVECYLYKDVLLSVKLFISVANTRRKKLCTEEEEETIMTSNISSYYIYFIISYF
jgi:hypothetical protein